MPNREVVFQNSISYCAISDIYVLSNGWIGTAPPKKLPAPIPTHVPSTPVINPITIPTTATLNPSALATTLISIPVPTTPVIDSIIVPKTDSHIPSALVTIPISIPVSTSPVINPLINPIPDTPVIQTTSPSSTPESFYSSISTVDRTFDFPTHSDSFISSLDIPANTFENTTLPSVTGLVGETWTVKRSLFDGDAESENDAKRICIEEDEYKISSVESPY
ncbi:hypothetical protein LOD99_7777 [Oopsacas minuta]|uniref:Uncharacterized protein n=1 Tax=Oopsacas minuta TaxID=111878 RepID=A0AAV7JQU9_9METZ|nr:hypothetical protein LOD99_7777 [Oopsacas minuta]